MTCFNVPKAWSIDCDTSFAKGTLLFGLCKYQPNGLIWPLQSYKRRVCCIPKVANEMESITIMSVERTWTPKSSFLDLKWRLRFISGTKPFVIYTVIPSHFSDTERKNTKRSGRMSRRLPRSSPWFWFRLLELFCVLWCILLLL